MNLKLLIRILCNCLIAVLVLELCARIDDYVSFGAPILSVYNTDSLYEQDYVGKRGKPNARYKKWQLNSLGYRGPEVKAGKTQAVCFGSSETFGLYEAPGEEYPRQLEREINARLGGDSFQVTNVAYPGETIATATERVPEIVNAIHPQYAFIYPSPATYIWLPWLDASKSKKQQPKPTAAFEWRIAENVRIILKQLIPETIQTRLRAREIRLAARDYPVMDRLPDENVQRFRRDLVALVTALKGHGTQPILVTHATIFGQTPSEKDQEMLLAWRKFYPMLKEEGFLDMERRINDAIRSVAAEQGVPLIDAATAVPPGKEYFADFVHFTNLGAKTIANVLAQSLAFHKS